MNRRNFLQVGSATALVTLAGCTALGFDAGSEDVVEARVDARIVWADVTQEGHPDGSDQIELVHVASDHVRLHPRVETATGLSGDDLDPDVRLTDLPMDEIAAEIPTWRLFGEFGLRMVTPDSVNGNDSTDECCFWYVGPAEYFDHLDVGETHRLRVAEPDGYYSRSGHGRVVDILG